jgi:hypothetical protein
MLSIFICSTCCLQVRPAVLRSWAIHAVYKKMGVNIRVDDAALLAYAQVGDCGVPASLLAAVKVMNTDKDAQHATNLVAGQVAGYANVRTMPTPEPAPGDHQPMPDVLRSLQFPVSVYTLQHQHPHCSTLKRAGWIVCESVDDIDYLWNAHAISPGSLATLLWQASTTPGGRLTPGIDATGPNGTWHNINILFMFVASRRTTKYHNAQ